MSDKSIGRAIGTIAAILCLLTIGIIAALPPSPVPVAAPGTVGAPTPINITTILGIVSSVATMFGMTSLASFLGLFSRFLPSKDATPPDPPKTDTDGKAPQPSDAMQMVLDLGTLGYHAGLYHASKDDAEKAKIREAASILNAKLFAEWFPEAGAKS